MKKLNKNIFDFFFLSAIQPRLISFTKDRDLKQHPNFLKLEFRNNEGTENDVLASSIVQYC